MAKKKDKTSNNTTAKVGNATVNSSVGKGKPITAKKMYNEAVDAYQDALSGSYVTNDVAKKAVGQLADALKAPETYRNTLGDYTAEGTQLRDDYKDYLDYGSVLGKYDAATDAAYALSRAEQIQAMNRAEDSNYANTKNGIKSLRDSLVGSASSGANVGAANATALQALLGLGQQNAAATTQGMQAYQNNAKEMAAQRAANAVTALEFNKGATDSMYGNANSAYGSDMTALGQAAYGAGTGLGQVASTMEQAQNDYAMNEASIAGQMSTNLANLAAAKLAQKQTVYNKK